MPITRRTFLESAGATLAASALSQADEAPIRVAVIGTGGRGSDLIRVLTTIDDATIIGVCDDYPPHLEQGAKYAGPQAKTFSDYRKLLDELKPQAVVIARCICITRLRRVASQRVAMFFSKRRCVIPSPKPKSSPRKSKRQSAYSRLDCNAAPMRFTNKPRRWSPPE